jgi:transcriptional regulator with XRE-family HTH domain
MGGSTVTEPHRSDEPDEFDDYLEESLRSPSFRAAFEDAEERSRVLGALVRLRRTMKLSQTEVARRMSTTQSSVSDLENGKTDPLLSTLQRYARAVTGRVRVRIEMPTDCPWMPSTGSAYEQSSTLNVKVAEPLHRSLAEPWTRAWRSTADHRADLSANCLSQADKAKA